MSHNHIKLRNFEKGDILRCADMAASVWPVLSNIVAEKYVKRLMIAYVELSRIASNWDKVAIIDKKVVGYIFGRNNLSIKSENTLRTAISSSTILLKIILGRYGKIPNRFTFLKHLFETQKKVILNTPQADGEIEQFVVDPNFQGKGIGKHLLRQFIRSLEQKNANLITVYTDPLSNWRFYEKMAFKRHHSFIDDFNSYISKKKTEGYIYVLNLN